MRIHKIFFRISELEFLIMLLQNNVKNKKFIIKISENFQAITNKLELEIHDQVEIFPTTIGISEKC